MNQAEGVWCERAFAPWGDMEEEMRKEHIPLYALESGDSLKEFDFVGFSLGYEMAYTNVLNMLDLAHIPLHSDQRGEDDPIIVAGGTCVYNGEPLADFIDIFSLGEGEDVTLEMIDLYRKGKQAGWSRAEFLRNAAQVPGLYVPSLYEISYHQDGTVQAITPTHGAPEHIRKRIVADLDKSYFPVKTIIPSTDIVHDRVMLEVFRGCIRGCRFCQAGYCYRPVRPKSVDLLVQQGIASCKDSGYQEMTLSSLSTSDYRPLTELCDGLLEYCDPRNININLPSLRADGFSMGIMQRLQRVRKTSITFAPEAGTQRMRDTINKNVKEEDLLQSCRTAFEGGCNAVKLYFMLGLPTETDEDVIGIARLAEKVYWTWKNYAVNKSRGLRITVSTSFFVPKPFTPFQWEAQITRDEYHRRVDLLRGSIKNKSIQYNWHEMETQLHRSGAGSWRPAAGEAAGNGLAQGWAAGLLERVFLLRALDGSLCRDWHRPRFLRPAGAPQGRDPALEHDRHWRSPGIPVAGTGAGISLGHHAGLPSAVHGLRRQLPAAGRRVL